jgi:hypothetical protein
MNLAEAAKQLNLPKAEVAKRGTALKFNLSSLTEENIKAIANYTTDKPALTSQPSPFDNAVIEPVEMQGKRPSPSQPKSNVTVNENPQTLSQKLEDLKTTLAAGKATETHLSNEFLRNKHEAGIAIGQLGEMVKAKGLVEGSVTTAAEIYSTLIADDRQRVADVAAMVFGEGKSIQELYHDATQVKALESQRIEMNLTQQ